MTQTSYVCKGLVRSAKESNTMITSFRSVVVGAPLPAVVTRYNCSRLVVSARLLCIASIAASSFSHDVSSKSVGISGFTKWQSIYKIVVYVCCAVGLVLWVYLSRMTWKCLDFEFLFSATPKARLCCFIRHEFEGSCTPICHDGKKPFSSTEPWRERSYEYTEIFFDRTQWVKH